MQVIFTSIITGLSVAIPSIIATLSSNKSRTAVFNYRMDKLEEKVSTHNNLIDRMYKVESRVTLLEDNVSDVKEKK